MMQRAKPGYLALLVAAVGVSGCAGQVIVTEPPSPMAGGMEMDQSADDLVPLVAGIYEGEEVLFIHTKASHAEVASLLTDMMGPEVVTVPSLADIPPELPGNVYVFTNGVAGDGPMGFQPDVFDSVPVDPDYTPLRTLNRVTWQDEGAARRLNSVAEIVAAAAADEITIERTEIVINMPILVWPGGSR